MSKAGFTCGVAALALGLALAITPATAHADSGAQAAARAAQSQHGGRVLAVERRGDHYRVKLLKESGKVKVVRVPASGSERAGDASAREAGSPSEKKEKHGKEHQETGKAR